MVETILYQEWKKLSMTGFWNFLSVNFRRDFDTLDYSVRKAKYG